MCVCVVEEEMIDLNQKQEAPQMMSLLLGQLFFFFFIHDKNSTLV